MPTTETLVQSPTIGAIDNADLLWVWDNSDSALKKVSRSSLVGGTITGNGTINTNGATFTIPASGGTSAILDQNITSWSPAWTFSTSGSVTSSSTGRYIIINGIATVWGFIAVSALSSPSGNASITLPYNCAVIANYYVPVAVTIVNNWATSMTLRGFILGSTTGSANTRIQFQTHASNVSATFLNSADFLSNSTLAFSCSYIVA